MGNALTKYSALPADKQKAVRLRAEGVTVDAISAELGIPYRTVQDWIVPSGSCAEELAEYKSHLATMAIKAAEDLQATIQKDAVIAWERLKAIATCTDTNDIPAHVSQAAADSMLDRAGIARVSKTEGKTTLSVTDDTRLKRFEELADMQRDLPVDRVRLLAGNGDPQ